MKTLNKENLKGFGILLIQSIGFACFLLAIEVNGFGNAFSMKYAFDLIVLVSVAVIPLYLLYLPFSQGRHRNFALRLLISGFMVGGFLQLGGGEVDNHLLWFLIRSLFVMIILAGSVAIAAMVSKITS